MAVSYDDLEIGSSYSTRQNITAEHVRRFALLTNQSPTANEEYVHHTLLLGFISKILGHDFPGHGTVAVAMSTEFLHAPEVDTEVQVTVTIVDKNEGRGQITGRVTVTADGREILRGEAMLIPPETDEIRERC